MAKTRKERGRLRQTVQLLWTALTNGYLAGFLKGKIYAGPLKNVCVPGLNCYSCPGALGACPVGSFQAMLTGFEPRLPLYVVGFLFAFGALLGRFVCGWLCPFGLVQDLLYKIPLGRKRLNLPGDRALRRLKYAVLALFVVILPLFVRDDLIGVSYPWFCKYICPSGTLMGGWTLLSLNENLRGAAGWLFTWKSALLIALIVLSVKSFRPFCKYLCPLGAFYGFFNRIALLRYGFDEQKCVACGRCAVSCPMTLKLPQGTNGDECIRCGRCIRACPTAALTPALKQSAVARRKPSPERP